MNKYLVHVYAFVRVPVEVEAESQIAAVEKMNETFSLSDYLGSAGNAGIIHDAEDVMEFHVDNVGDEDHHNSQSYKIDVDGEIVRTRE